jgi:hypothetical protein
MISVAGSMISVAGLGFFSCPFSFTPRMTAGEAVK